ncbi:hypothetical protein DNTS_029604 [Danionella cerebrum]|uniref:Neural chondroitin sulphate proteoglycan cytoplasmic domain-containing protein n=1 Tax=Danionella cerebrum TaxID=2873325 RepID=A0A553N5P1_9TELE|nr:hypothetical protein DNTS_029604 [Danionella translucida]
MGRARGEEEEEEGVGRQPKSFSLAERIPPRERAAHTTFILTDFSAQRKHEPIGVEMLEHADALRPSARLLDTALSTCWTLTLVESFFYVLILVMSKTAVDELCTFVKAAVMAAGNLVLANETEADISVNGTSLSMEVEKIEHASEINSLSSSSDLTHNERKMRGEEVGSGMVEEAFSPTTGMPTSSQGATTLGIPEITTNSAGKDHLIPFMEEEEQEVEVSIRKEVEMTVRQQEPTQPPWQDAKGDVETTVFDLDHETSPATSSPTNPPSTPDVTVDFFDSDSHRKNVDPPSQSPHELQGRDSTSWGMPESYDYMTPYDDTVSPTTEDYLYTSTTDSFNDIISTTPPPPPRRFPPRFPSNPAFMFPKRPTMEEEPRAPPGMVDSVNGSECRQGSVRINGSCKSQCDLQPNFCLNGGQCYVMEGTQMFCRCNIQDYMWNKGSRCESVITEFQVMCIAIGASALMVLLLFMIVVCFAKKLHVLKTENSKLRKRSSSKYRPSSEHHNDNFSLSTIAEGSHPNVRKLCDTPPNLPHARALAYYDNIICQVTCFVFLFALPSTPLCMDPERNLSLKEGLHCLFSAQKVCSQIDLLDLASLPKWPGLHSFKGKPEVGVNHQQKTMSRYTWECKTKEDPDCEDDPNAQNKLEDPVKAPPPKEDESLNIQNSLTPKHENHKVLGEENSSEVNSLQNNMM